MVVIPENKGQIVSIIGNVGLFIYLFVITVIYYAIKNMDSGIVIVVE